MNREKQLTIELLCEKLQRISGKKVILESGSEKTFSVYKLSHGQPSYFWNEKAKEFTSDVKKATLYSADEATKVKNKLLEPLIANYQKTGKNYSELHTGDLFKKKMLKEEVNEEKPQALHILNSSSKIKTLEPNQNEYVEEGLAYFLLKLEANNRKVIVSGSGKTDFYGKVGGEFYLFDDGNKTTSFPTSYNLRSGKKKSIYTGSAAEIIATANTPDEIKNFPTGSYQLYVMK